MADSLAASFFSSNAHKNIAVPGNTVSFTFQKPPNSANNVKISVLETVAFLDSGDTAVTDRLVGGFVGHFTGGVFKIDTIFGAPLPAVPDPVTIRIAASLAPDAPHLFAHMPEPERILSHTLRLQVQGTVNGASLTFDGQSLIQMEYPLAMIVPSHLTPANDRSLNLLDGWSQQWKKFKPDFRHVEHLTPVAFTRNIQPSDYNALIAALRSAAKAATAGVVALAVGHGDNGDSRGNTIAWCNMVPENFAPPENTPFRYNLDIDEAVLLDGTPPNDKIVRTPPRASLVKLDALDRLGDIFEETPIRRLLLHTCSAGKNRSFLQQIADRIRVPVIAHTKKIAYEDTTVGNIGCSYDGDQPQKPRDLRHWLVAHLTDPVRPASSRPRRFGPPP